LPPQSRMVIYLISPSLAHFDAAILTLEGTSLCIRSISPLLIASFHVYGNVYETSKASFAPPIKITLFKEESVNDIINDYPVTWLSNLSMYVVSTPLISRKFR